MSRRRRPGRTARDERPSLAVAGFLVFCGLSAVASVAVATSGADAETLIWGQLAVGAAYGVGALVGLLAGGERRQRPRRPSPVSVRLALTAAYLASVALGLPLAADEDATMTLLVSPLLHLVGAGSGLCVAALVAIGVQALRVAVRPGLEGPRALRWGARAFAAALGTILLVLVPAATLDTFAYDSPYDGRRSPDWPLLLVGVERAGVVVHHPGLLVAARVAWWAMLAGFLVLIALVGSALVAARRRPSGTDPDPA